MAEQFCGYPKKSSNLYTLTQWNSWYVNYMSIKALKFKSLSGSFLSPNTMQNLVSFTLASKQPSLF